MRREYAVPTPYHQAANDNLDGLRQQLAAAETAAASSQTWSARTRAEQDAKQLRAQIAGGGLHRRAERSVAHVAGNRQFLPPAPYFAASRKPGVAANLASLSWSQLGEVVPAAMAELQRVGATR